MKAFTGQVKVLADEPRAGKIMRCVLKLLGGEEKAEKKGAWAGYTKGPVITDHVRQELGMSVFDAFSKMLMLGLVENPGPPAHKSDLWRLTKTGEDAVLVVFQEENGEADLEDAPRIPADTKRGRRRRDKDEGGD